ncbi:hypothetical protein GWC77_26045 [Paraburkholderia sp. NMBU_R16]|uniref:hypothetical protein n=1 Tax=Paraburkholderia sp. NMBU_R16 TaxID=2698676 RepID=UPI00156402EB|nr:hypothetical protein [Paraburkholderia sp. NMBU_R16]NRO99352.1 hypothetical protein [Paraburkholderia sp. NMBU_R16]
MYKTTQEESRSLGAAPDWAGPNAHAAVGFEEQMSAPRAGFVRPALLAVSAASLALGVAGTVAYGVWFNHDQRIYANAMESARRALRLNDRPPTIQASAGIVLPQPTFAPQLTERAGPAQAAAPAPAQPAVAAAQPEPPRPAPAPAKRATVSTRAEAPARAKTSHNPFRKIAAFFRPSNYRHHGTRRQPDAFGRP